MIKSFKCKKTQKLFIEGIRPKKLPANLYKRAISKLAMVNRSKKLEDLKIPPSNHLEILIGNRKGQHSIRINDKYRVCFKWSDKNAYDVEINNHYKNT